MATMTSAEQAQMLYVAYYGRPADKAGQDFWATQIDNVGVEGVAADFGNSDEFQANFGDLTNEELVGNLYQQLFNRAGETAGVDYWTDLLGEGVPLAQIAFEIANGAQNDDQTALNNKLTIAQEFTDAAGDDYAGDDAAEYAQGVLAGVDENTDTDAFDVDGAVADIPQPANPGDTFSLTAGVDDLTGTADDDVFTAGLDQVTDPSNGTQSPFQTLTDVDIIDGGEGNDRLNARLVDSSADGVAISNVEELYLRSTGSGTSALDMSNVTGAEQVWNDRSTNGLALTEVQNAVTVGLNQTAAGSTYAVEYAADVLGTTAAQQSIVTNDAGSATSAVSVDLTLASGSTDAITGLNVAATGANNLDLSGSTGLSSVTDLTVTGEGSVNLNTLNAGLETVAAGENTGGVSFTAGDDALQEVTTGAGDDNIKLAGDLAQDGFVVTGAGNDTVDADTKNVDAGARIELGAGDDVVTNLGTVDKDAVVDGGEGTDTLQLQAVAAANVGAFQNFEVFDVDSLNKTLDMNILSTNNDVQEIVGSGALGGASELVNLGDGVGFRATGDMSTGSNTLTLTQKTAGALDVTLDADQAATAGASAYNDATTDVNATNATSVNVAFDSESVNEIAGSISNTQTITLETGAAASINVVSGGENAANVLTLTDSSTDGPTSANSLLESIVITGDQDITLTDITFSGGANAVESIDASGLTGALNASLANLSNGGTLELGSGADRITVTNDSTLSDATGTDVETITGFEKSASTTDAELIDDADQLVGTYTVAADGTGTGYEIADGVLSFTGAGPATLQDAFNLADTAANSAANEAVVFEYTGDTYAFIEADGTGTADDTLVKLAGVTDVDSLNVDSGNLYIA